MRLELFVTADYANMAENGKLNVMGIFTEVLCSEFPATHPDLSLVAGLTASPAEYGRQRQVTFKLMDEDGQEVLKELTIPATPAEGNRNLWFIIRMRDLVFERPGTYQFSLLVDNDEKGSIPLQVRGLSQEDAGNQWEDKQSS